MGSCGILHHRENSRAALSRQQFWVLIRILEVPAADELGKLQSLLLTSIFYQSTLGLPESLGYWPATE